MFCGLDGKSLIDSSNPTCDTPQDQILMTQNKKASVRHRKQVTEGIKAADTPNRLKNLDEETQESMSEHQSPLLKILDDETDEIMKKAEQDLPINPFSWWSLAPHKPHTVCKCWKAKISFMKNNVDDKQDILGQLQNDIPSKTDVFLMPQSAHHHMHEW